MLRLTLIIVSLTFVACATQPHHNLERVREGMDKDQVLDLVGNPKRTFRQDGQDHWIYVYFEGERQLTQRVDFRGGRVVRVQRGGATQELLQDLENSGSMEEYERAVKQHKSKASAFKDQ